MSDYAAASEPEQQRVQIQRMIDNVHVALPVRVTSFSGTGTPTVTVQPLTQMKITLGNEVTYRSLPLVTGVPVVLPYAQTMGLALTLPIKPGDTGLMIIPDRGLDNFLQMSGEESPPPFTGDPTVVAPRAHSITDGVFVPGLCANSMVLQDYNTDNIEIRDGERKNFISLGTNGIEISDGTCSMTMKDGEFKVSTPKSVAIRGDNMDFGTSGNTIRGNLTSVGGTFIDSEGVVLGSHVHEGVQTGSDTTDAPQK